MAPVIRVAELFAGVGGFRLGLEGHSNPDNTSLFMAPAGKFRTVWANQWEPPGKPSRQFAWRCYESHFGEGSCVNEDISMVLDKVERGETTIPEFDMLVGGFPCQDYSVANTLSLAKGIKGKKGILWWQIYRLLQMRHPRYVLLENVDRLLKSPKEQRGRDFAIILSCLFREGYSVEWRVINAADYGMPQRRRRVFIYAERTDEKWDLENRLLRTGVIAAAFPIREMLNRQATGRVTNNPQEMSARFGTDSKTSVFQNAGIMQSGLFYTAHTSPNYTGKRSVLKDIVVDDACVPESYFIPDDKVVEWVWARSSKSIERKARNGFTYKYSEGAMQWPDPLDKPARTILTAEGGAGASRMKHAIRGNSGRFRRLVPDELDQIQMFPRGWTNTGMTDAQRAFCMGNALVVGIPHQIGKEIARRAGAD